MKLKIATDFSTSPGPRYISEGKFSGEEFRKQLLLPMLQEAIQSNCCLEVDLDGTAGYGTSFLEESFGGLIRDEHIDLKTIRDKVKIISNDQPDLLPEIDEYLKEADEEAHAK